jgi:hypothetical protein
MSQIFGLNANVFDNSNLFQPWPGRKKVRPSQVGPQPLLEILDSASKCFSSTKKDYNSGASMIILTFFIFLA